jgi:hypothetical protein
MEKHGVFCSLSGFTRRSVVLSRTGVSLVKIFFVYLGNAGMKHKIPWAKRQYMGTILHVFHICPRYLKILFLWGNNYEIRLSGYFFLPFYAGSFVLYRARANPWRGGWTAKSDQP